MGIEKVVLLPTPRRVATRPQTVPIVPFREWIEARDRAASALLGGARRVIVTGPAGTGKTVLLDQVARVLRAAGRNVAVQLADVDPAPPGADQTLFVDEADRLEPPRLRALQDSAGTVVLAGLPGTLTRRLPSGTVHLALEPLGRDGAREYIAGWLHLTNRRVADLDSPGVRRLVELSGGVPRLLSTLLAASAWVAETSGAPVITADHVQEAAELRSVLGTSEPTIEPAAPRSNRAAWSVVLIVVVIGAAFAAAAPRLFPAETARVLATGGKWAEDAERWVRQTLNPKAAPGRDLPIRPAPALLAPPTPAVVTAPAPAVPSVPEQPAAAQPERATTAQAPTAEPPVLDHPVATPQTAAPQVTAPVIEALPVETVEFMIRRGRQMLGLADVSAARLLFRRAADAGSNEAMLDLAQTYDPAYLAGIGAAGQANPKEMTLWLGRAAAAGNADAAARLENKTSR